MFDVLQEMTTTYRSLDSVAQTYAFDLADIDTAIADADPDSAEYVCLQVLRRYARPSASAD